MKVTGIIAEYNPFHSGHKYQLDFAKSISDAVVIVMSGSFVQRGEAAIFDKWSRARVALNSGADLIIELPVVFSMNTAERFAFGGVSILDKLGICDTLLFGSECGDISVLKDAAYLLENETEEISKKIRTSLESGTRYAKAREDAYKGLISSSLLSNPNNILGIEYIRQLYRRNSKIEPVTLKREGSGYHDKTLSNTHSSASAIRNAIYNEGLEYEPFSDCEIHKTEKLMPEILYNIQKNEKDAFLNICDVSEGLENRIIRAAQNSLSFDELVAKVSTKRYTDTRIRRVILSSLLGLSTELSKLDPDYARILGASKKGFELIREIKEKSSLKVITKTADFKEENPLFKKDILATDIYELTSSAYQGFGADYKNSPVILGGNDE